MKVQQAKSIPLLGKSSKRARLARSKDAYPSSPSKLSSANQDELENKVADLTIELRKK